MSEPTSDGLEAARAEVRARVSAARSQCRAMYRLLPDDEPWRGPASMAFRLRVSELRACLDAVRVTLELAEVEL